MSPCVHVCNGGECGWPDEMCGCHDGDHECTTPADCQAWDRENLESGEYKPVVLQQWAVVPSDHRRASGAVVRHFDTLEDATEWITWCRSDERRDELQKAADEEEAADFPQGNPATYANARHKERTWTLQTRTVTPWEVIEP